MFGYQLLERERNLYSDVWQLSTKLGAQTNPSLPLLPSFLQCQTFYFSFLDRTVLKDSNEETVVRTK